MRVASVLRRALVPLLLAAAACGTVETIKDLQSLVGALQERFGESVSVNLSNGRLLTLTFVNSRIADLPGEERTRIAREAAVFALARFPGAAAVDRVEVAFQSMRGGAGVTVSRTETPMSFRAAELRAAVDSLRAATDTTRATGAPASAMPAPAAPAPADSAPPGGGAAPPPAP